MLKSQRIKSNTKIKWAFIVNKYNEHQVETAKKMEQKEKFIKINELLDCDCDYDENQREIAETIPDVSFQKDNVVHHLILNTVLKSYAQKAQENTYKNSYDFVI